MARLPQPGGDKGSWGDILNDFLSQAHNADGSLKPVAQSEITGLSASLAAKADSSSLATVATSGSYADLANKPTIPASAASIGAEPAGLSSATQSSLASTYATLTQLASKADANAETSLWRAIGSGAQPVYVTASTPAGTNTGGTGVKKIHNGPNALTALRVTWGNYTAGAQEAHSVGTSLSATTTAGATSITTPISIAAGTTIVILGANSETAVTGTPSGTGPYTIPVTTALVYGHTAGVTILANYGTINIQTATLEYPQGTFTPIGIRSGTGASVAAGFDIVSDVVAVTIPANVDFWIRTYATWSANQNIALQQMPTYTNQSSDLSATPVDKTQVSGNAGFQTVGLAPIRVEAQVSITSKTLFVDGDSITNGTGDGLDFSRGYVNFACDGVVDVQKVAAPTTRAMYEASPATRYRKARLLNGCTAAYENYGINDLSNSQTVAQLQANKILLWQWLGSAPGIRRVYCGTLVPLTTTSDGWTSVGGQTLLSMETNRTTFNSWIRDGAPLVSTSNLTPAATGTVGALRAGSVGHPLAGFIDVAATVEVNSANTLTLNGGYWKVPSTGRTVTDAAITSGAHVVTSATAAFTSADVGRVITVAGAGASGGLYVAVIQTVNSSTQATMNTPGSTNASTTVSGATMKIGASWTQDGTHPSTEAHQAMAVPFAAALSALIA